MKIALVTMTDGTSIELELDFENTHRWKHTIEEWPEQVESVAFLDDKKERIFIREDFDGRISNMYKVGMALYAAINWLEDPLYPRHADRQMPRYVLSVKREGCLSIHNLAQCHGNYKFVSERKNEWHIRRVYLDKTLCDRSLDEEEDTRRPVPEGQICATCLKRIRAESGMEEI